ncbi:fungal-specific transcription factor domain-containing protein [Mycena amicta]|nr:fungal-specific transcription factor domain-containing protein [Mycena amicta]
MGQDAIEVEDVTSQAAQPTNSPADSWTDAVDNRLTMLTNTFSATYNTVFVDDMYSPPPPLGQRLDTNVQPLRLSLETWRFERRAGDLLHRQCHELALFHKRQIQSVIVPSVKLPGASREAAKLLALVHVKRSQYQSSSFTAMRDPDTKRRYDELLDVLSYEKHTEDDALAAISIISTFLVDGGAGAWSEWLGVLYNYARSVFGASDARETLLTCSEPTRFIIKTAIWFDVLAAITTQEQPRFLRHIRELFSPLQSGVFDPAPELSMMNGNVMGCENIVVWLLAEASALSVWKRKQHANGRLSIPDLVDRATVLEQELSQFSPSMDSVPFNSTQTEEERALSADIFRGATLVFLRTIVFGDFPQVREIEDAVADTMTLLRTPKIPTSVVRSTVFAFFVCGALTDDPRHREAVVTEIYPRQRSRTVARSRRCWRRFGGLGQKINAVSQSDGEMCCERPRCSLYLSFCSCFRLVLLLVVLQFFVVDQIPAFT